MTNSIDAVNKIESAHILIVDDLLANVQLVADILDDEGYQNIATLTDPRKVLKYCQQHNPDMILLDIRMPHLSGLDVLALLQEHYQNALPFIIVLTAENDASAKTRALDMGAIDYLLKPFDQVELVSKVSNLLVHGIQIKEKTAHNKELVRLLTNSIDELSEMSIQDPISELPNLFAISLHIKEQYRQQNPLSAILISIDGMEDIENIHGHNITEILFKQVIDICSVTSALKNPFLGCWSGYQLMLLSRTHDLHAVQNYLHNINELLNGTFAVEDMLLRVKVRMGACLNSSVLKNESELLHRCIIALPKKTDKEKICLYSQELEMQIQRENHIKQALANAIIKNEFELVYQPKIDLATNKITGAEALIRWQSPTLGFVMPNEFISIAEHTGDILPLGTWIIKRALHDLQVFLQHPKVDDHFCLAINLSVTQILEKDFTGIFLDLVDQSGIDPKSIQVEVTESLMIEDTQWIHNQLNILRQAGISVALDDFGTGYSSLSYLRELPIDVLKIDRSFIRDITQNQEANMLVKAIIHLAQIFRLKIVAEGIEERVQAEVLNDMGCDEAQGYFFAKPLSFNDFELRLAS